MKSAQTEPSTIFGLRYLEEEDLEITDIVGCQSIAGANPREGTLGISSVFYTGISCDQTDDDNGNPAPQ